MTAGAGPLSDVANREDPVPALRAEALTKRYGAVVAVDRVSLQIRAGEVCGSPGPNGAGKTATLRMLLGLVRPTAGRAEALGRVPALPGRSR